ncbi:MAG: hypothetical protein KAS66_13375 [Candidatus Omnitrophica bacterium]|nr:hypothetical protein [Candidatus Omnitrophota bacterium]
MIEKAIFISSLEDFRYVTKDYTRLYFGVEFCERLIPSVKQLNNALSFSQENKLDFTFMTPFVTDKGIARLEPLFDYLDNQVVQKAEIIINDWGVLNLLNKRKWNGLLALGRLLTKQKRGPRIMNIRDKLPERALEHFKQSNIDVPILSEFLIEKGIQRVELDNLLQGISRPDAILKGSLYFPYAYVTVTRYCLSSFSRNKSVNLRSISPCDKECLKHNFKLHHKSMPVDLLLRGNAQFFKNNKLPEDLDALNIDRLVFEPKIPA